VKLREEIRKHKGSRIVVVADKRLNGYYFVNTKNRYKKVLDDLQLKLIALDAAERDEQDLVFIFNTDFADKLIIDIFEVANIVRAKLIKI